jgi:hypothetical protein
VVAASYPFLDVLWSMLIFFLFIIWFYVLIVVFADIFRRHDASGLKKTAWIIFLIIAPFLGVLIYLIINNDGMVERRMGEARAAQAGMDEYIRSVAQGPAGEIEKAKALLDSGAITQAEFDAIKQKALAS